MRDGVDRRPGAVADDGGHVEEIGFDDLRHGVDTDGDGRPDTLLTDDGTDLLVLTDLDGDGFADRTVCIGPDGSVHTAGVFHARPSRCVPGQDDGDGDGPVTGHAPAHSVWGALLGHLFGS